MMLDRAYLAESMPLLPGGVGEQDTVVPVKGP